jgi:hypothetical protein
MNRAQTAVAALALLICAIAQAGQPPGQARGPQAVTLAEPVIALTAGGGPLHVEAQDQDGNRLAPDPFTWAVPAGLTLAIQQDPAGWQVAAPAGAAPGSYAVLVQYNPNPALSPTVAVVIGQPPITAIKILPSPAP